MMEHIAYTTNSKLEDSGMQCEAGALTSIPVRFAKGSALDRRPLTVHKRREPSSAAVMTTSDPKHGTQKPFSTGVPPCACQETL